MCFLFAILGLDLGNVVPLVEDEEEQAPEGYFDRHSHSLASLDDFASLGLSRNVMKCLADCGWLKPSPVQGSVVPVALEGRDLCVSASTGSGKTGAFALPSIERLLLLPDR
jgi:ATP-dependent RNA helicase DDX27